MNDKGQLHCIIVGQGLAGSAVALQLLRQGHRFLILDDPSRHSASRIAAGIFNPVTGMTMVKTWLADEIFPALHEFYSEAERLTRKKFFYPMPVYRPFVSAGEQNEWMARSTDERYERYVREISGSAGRCAVARDPYGGVVLNHAGYLDTPAYLHAVRVHLEEEGVFRAGIFEDDLLEIHKNGVRYGDNDAQKIIFCQGTDNATNRWFQHLPVRPLKGEVLSVEADWNTDMILNRGVYAVPGSQLNTWRVGATYDWRDRHPGVTEASRRILTEKLDALVRAPYVVTGQQWGFRPTTPDRKPMLGAHPQYDRLIIFNGLGTKGVSLAPYFSAVLVRWMQGEGTIHREADVTRYN